MIKYFARATSLERRFLISAALVAFLLFNYLAVWPKFSEWGNVQARDLNAHSKLDLFKNKIAKKAAIETEINKYERSGGNVPSEDQSSDFIRGIQNQAAASGLVIQSSTRMPDRTNEFFVEKAQALTYVTTDQPLVDFLYNLSSAGNSLIRVRGLSLRPDAPHQNLSVNVTLVSSYQKKVIAPPPPAKGAPAAAPAPAKTNPPALKTAPIQSPAAKTSKGTDNKSPVVPPPGVPKPQTPKK